MTPIFLKNVLTFNGQSLLYPKKQRIRSKKGFFIYVNTIVTEGTISHKTHQEFIVTGEK